METAAQDQPFSPWNPGIEPDIPPQYRNLETIYHPDIVFTTLDEVNELVAETGLSEIELITFRPHRLVLHELIVRVTADIVVLEGESEEDLGINFRAITSNILQQYIEPHLDLIEQGYRDFSSRIETLVHKEVEQLLLQLSPPKPPVPTLWQRLLGSKPKSAVAQPSRQQREFELINDYIAKQN